MNAFDQRARTAFAAEPKRVVPAAARLFVVRIVEPCEPELIGREELDCEVTAVSDASWSAGGEHDAARAATTAISVLPCAMGWSSSA